MFKKYNTSSIVSLDFQVRWMKIEVYHCVQYHVQYNLINSVFGAKTIKTFSTNGKKLKKYFNIMNINKIFNKTNLRY